MNRDDVFYKQKLIHERLPNYAAVIDFVNEKGICEIASIVHDNGFHLYYWCYELSDGKMIFEYWAVVYYLKGGEV